MSKGILAIGLMLLLRPGASYAADGPATMPWQVDWIGNLPAAQIPAAIAEAKARVQKDQAEQDRLNGEIRKLTGGRLDTYADTLQKAATKLDDEIDDATLEADAIHARKGAITEQIDLLSKRRQDAVDKDPVAAELQKVVDVRQGEVNRDTKLVDAATMSRADLDQAVAALGEAKAQLALQRERAAMAAGGDAMGGLQKELIDATIDETVQTGRLAELNDRREKLRKTLDLANSLALVRGDEEQANNDVVNGTNALAVDEKENTAATQP
jgi:hypothetical protein